MKTAAEYLSKLRSMRPNVYSHGELADRDDPCLLPELNTLSTTYDLAADPQHEAIMTAVSHISGKRINRFTHVNQTPDDLLKKQEMVRLCSQRVGGCILRCMGIDAVNALSVVTREMDDALGTEYYPRFLKYLEYFQENDITGNCAQTDVKGDRKLRPHEQPDPDLYLRVVEKRKDGIIVRGAKAHNSVGPHAEEIIVLPTRALAKEEGDWAVAFAVPGDAEGVVQLCVPKGFRERRHLKAPLAQFGGADSLTVFDNVFVPWDRVFMCGEWQYGGRLALLFALYHRHSYTGCKPGIMDVLMGLVSLVADYSGLADAQHIKHKLADMAAVAELVYGAGIAGGVKGKRSSSGTCIPDVVYCNAGRYHAGMNIYRAFETLVDVAGGIAATLPYEEEFLDQRTRPYAEKYIMRRKGVSAENQHRCFRMVNDLAGSAFTANKLIAGLHGGGSPIMEKIAILANYDLEARKKLAKALAGIVD
ncbi:MAG: aromatic ring hydroxylase [Chloroflexi bacterium]|nr:aromatic ring hydroxylase [Chloroflexota bacterium]